MRKSNDIKRGLILFICSGVISGINFVQIEISAGNDSLMQLRYVLLNFATIYFFNVVFWGVFRSAWLGSLTGGTFWSALAFVNYYVLQFRGMPISTQDIYNIRTAMGTVGAYEIRLTKISMIIIGLFLMIIAIALVTRIYERKNTIKLILKYKAMTLLLCVLGSYLYWGYFSSSPIKPRNVLTLSWYQGYHEYGFVACSVEVLCKSIQPVKKPEGYSVEKVKKIIEEYDSNQENKGTPDIILILNETFYDLNLITDTKPNRDIAAGINQLSGVVAGFSNVQVSGGGTSISEYELLTSNSMHLLYGITPFNSLKFSNSNSIVSYLKALGYNSLGAHPEHGVNYSRSRVYPDMGFDEVHFYEDFTELDFYGDRSLENGGMIYATDSSVYNNLIKWYNNMPEEPRFCYLLTMQNHSPYNMLKDEELLVRDANDYGKYDHDVDEYLSGVYLSIQAFVDLTKYFENMDRDVIICMVGDHAPVFASEIGNRKDTDEIMRDIYLTTTPYIIWSNYKTDEINMESQGISSLIYLVPTLLSQANVKLSPYYEYLLYLKNKAPIITQLEHYFDKNFNMHMYSDENDNTSLLEDYFNCEYNNIIAGKERLDDMFIP